MKTRVLLLISEFTKLSQKPMSSEHVRSEHQSATDDKAERAWAYGRAANGDCSSRAEKQRKASGEERARLTQGLLVSAVTELVLCPW